MRRFHRYAKVSAIRETFLDDPGRLVGHCIHRTVGELVLEEAARPHLGACAVDLGVAVGCLVLYLLIYGLILVLNWTYHVTFLFRQRELNRVFELADAGRLEAAIADLQGQIASKGLSGDRAHALALLMKQREDWGEAIRMFEEAERLGYDRAVAQYNRGLTLFESGHAEAALPLIQEAVRLYPNEIAIQSYRCRILAELDRVEEARALLDRIEHIRESINPPSTRGWLLIDRTIQECRDRLAVKPKTDLTALDEF
jgi:tetratricopeptide (TPR) repeat protein